MGELLVKLLNMSIAASWLILAVCLLRLLMKRAPRWIICAMWGLVAVRLICPITIESGISLVPSAEPVQVRQTQPAAEDTVRNDAATAMTGVQPADTTPYQGEAGNAPRQTGIPADEARQAFTGWDIAGIVWLVGGFVILGIALFHFIRLKKTLREAVPLRENVRICDAVASPFILGIVKPRIYLPSGMEDAQMEAVVAHENAHIRRLDPLWKLLGYVLLAVYWFNPLSWVAYQLFCRDIELACDERVIRTLPLPKKKEYCRALLACSTQKHMRLSFPLAFGEVGVKSRVKNVLNYKKPTFWVILIAVAACAVVCVCFMTNPKDKPEDITPEATEAMGSETTEMEYEPDAYGAVKIVPAAMTEELLPGADGASLDFANESRVVFHDYYGLFVFDYQKLEMIASLDLASIGCDKTQGDDACEVMVDEAGEKVYLHSMSSPDMYIFTPDWGTLEKSPYSMEGISVFNDFVDTADYLQPDYTMFRSQNGWLFTDGDGNSQVAVLLTGSGLPIDLAVAFFKWEGEGTLSSSYDDCRMIFRRNPERETLALLMEAYADELKWETNEPYDREHEAEGTHIYLAPVSEDEAYLLYCGAPGAGQMEKYLYRSQDGGASYEPVKNSLSTSNYPVGFAFCTEQKGLILTQYHGSEAYAYMTEDGGKTWEPYELDVPDAESSYYIDGVSLKKAEDNTWELILKGSFPGDELREFQYISSDNWETWELQ